MMDILPKRRKGDFYHRWDTVIKGIISFIVVSVLGFCGNWVVGVNTSIAKFNEQNISLTEKESFLSTWLVDNVKELKESVKEVAQEQKQLNTDLQRIATEQARRKGVIDKLEREVGK